VKVGEKTNLGQIVKPGFGFLCYIRSTIKIENSAHIKATRTLINNAH
jgi:hypothetical protein